MRTKSKERIAALELGVMFYSEDRPCKHGHKAPRYTRSAACTECNAIRAAKEYSENREAIIARVRIWQEQNPERARKIETDRRLRNPEKRRESSLASQRKYAEKYRPVRQKWIAENLDRKRANNASRRARMPKWVDRDACRIFYTIARRVSACTGIAFHVDHIVPLKGATVSGLHVPWNLRVIPALANMRKKNKFGSDKELLTIQNELLGEIA